MKLQELLPFLAENQNKFKVHCATPNGENNPLSIWLSGRDNFTKDQNIQTKKNFERKYILSFCEINKNGEWLFVGIYESFGVKEIIKDKNTGKELNIYDTRLTKEGKEFIGKLVVGFDLKEESPSAARQRYRYLESLLDKMEVLELKREVLKREFPGYDKVNISWKDLKNVIEDDVWINVLKNQKAIYLIVDCKTGKQYVGAAYGGDGLLGRWRDYIKTGHGGNKYLKELDFEYIKKNFKYTILETFNSNVDDKIIIGENKDGEGGREGFWKDVLLSRKFGYNAN
ncbi:GIY-YIG nuclease family protein [Campylobacter sp. 50012-21]|uniref:GIY-YIG nuclease family protein n=1 Tax=Campylobacter magnus TaxID=3026462 RepID=UPI00235DD753|nr:GIY-YIG nuclease family protein [Campylobacter magnus]MDD0845790.1 GIY-YIG nuclease family protein [Campylobacter magnus]